MQLLTMKQNLITKKNILQQKPDIFTNSERIKQCCTLKNLLHWATDSRTVWSYRIIQEMQTMLSLTKPILRPEISSSLINPCRLLLRINTSPQLFIIIDYHKKTVNTRLKQILSIIVKVKRTALYQKKGINLKNYLVWSKKPSHNLQDG